MTDGEKETMKRKKRHRGSSRDGSKNFFFKQVSRNSDEMKAEKSNFVKEKEEKRKKEKGMKGKRRIKK